MNDSSGSPGRAAYVGITIAAIFGVGWAQWAASGLGGVVGVIVRIVSVVLAVVLIVAAARRARQAPRTTRSLFSSRTYWIVVAVEVVLLFVGAFLLQTLALPVFVAPWIAFIVGVHFLMFGRFFQRSFYWVGGAIVVAGIVGFALGIVGLGANAVVAVTGLVVAAVLFLAAARGLLGGTSARNALPN
jgi:hypothetical protein